MLFVAFLSMHKANLVRTNFIIDLQNTRGKITFGYVSKNVVELSNDVALNTRGKRNLS